MRAFPNRAYDTPSDLRTLAALVHRTGRPLVTTLHGGSMGSSLPSGSLIRIHPLLAENCELGQVAVFEVNGGLVAHRIVYLGQGSRLGRFVLTHGDGRIFCDPPIERSAVLGVVTHYFKDGSWHPLERKSSRSRFRQSRASLHLAFIRLCMQLSVSMAQWIARSLLACSSLRAFKNSFRSDRRPLNDSTEEALGSRPLAFACVDHVNMNVRNLDESTEFYRRLFGTDGEIKDGGEKPLPWRIIGIPGKFYFCLYEVGAASFESDGMHINHLGFYVPDFDEVVRRVKNLRIPIEFEGKPLEWKNRNGISRSLYVKDPNGYLIEFAEKLGGGLG